MSKVEVNTVEPQCGTTLTLGGSGDTVALGSGASQTGFGRTGTVNWDTASIKTSTFTAVSGNGYFCNTTGGAITVNLPAGSAGDIVGLKDYAGTWDTYAVTLNPNGAQLIGGGSAVDPTLTSEGGAVLLVYVDGTQGWLTTAESVTSSPTGKELFIVATGGTPSQDGDYEIRTFTGPGTFCVSSLATCSANDTVDYLIVAGGGGGGTAGGAGGGAGGFRETPGTSTGCYSVSPIAGSVTAVSVSAAPYAIVVGGGGSGVATGLAPAGNVSSFNSQTSAGGGGGNSSNAAGGPGGSGGGGAGGASPGYCNPYVGGTGNDPSTSPAQGFDGGRGWDGQVVNNQGGGGGGATAVGTNAAASQGGIGGDGATTSISGAAVTRGGGGGGASDSVSSNNPRAGGSGGGGAGAPNRTPTPAVTPATAGTVNTGGGGGGGSYPGADSNGAGGGSGVVIIRYKFQ